MRTITSMWIALLIAWLGLVGSGSMAVAQDGTPSATPAAGGSGLEGAVSWLQSQQAADGGFVGFSGESDAGATVDAIVAFAAAESAGIDTGDSIDRALVYLESGDVALVYTQTGVGQSAKLVLGLRAAGVNPSGFAHVDPIMIVQNGQNPDTGIYGGGIYDHALSVLALIATGNEVPATALDAFAATQAENGGWAFDGATDSAMADSNTTAMAVLALTAAAEGEGEPVTRALAYLESTWTEAGAGYNAAPETVPDANSTALVIQAMVATGTDVSAYQPLLLAFQNPTGGFFYNADDSSDNLFATLQAIPAMAAWTYPGPAATPVAGDVWPTA